MNSAVVMEYVQARMQELRVKSYAVRWRHILVPPSTTVSLEAYGELFILISDFGGQEEIKIESEFGHFDLSVPQVEQHHEFQGLIKITNPTVKAIQIQFLQVIPKRK